MWVVSPSSDDLEFSNQKNGDQASLSDLKTLVRELEEIEADIQMLLVFNETLLEESMNATTLAVCGMEEGTTLTMVKKASPLVLTHHNDQKTVLCKK